MDTTGNFTLFTIGAIIALAFAIPWFIHYRRKSEKRKLARYFHEFVEANNLHLENEQSLHKNRIGIDREKLKLVFMEGSKFPPKSYLIDLREVSVCKVSKIRNKSTGYIHRIFLKIIFKDKEKKNLLLPIYNESTDKLFRMMRLSKKAQYWQKSIELFREPTTRILTAVSN